MSHEICNKYIRTNTLIWRFLNVLDYLELSVKVIMALYYGTIDKLYSTIGFW